MKSEIIDRLMEIEEEARRIAEDAIMQQKELPQKIHDKCNEIEKSIEEEYARNLKENIENIKTEGINKITEINNEKTSRIANMDNNFEINHEIWEKELLDSIIRR